MHVLSGGTPKTSVPDYWDGDIPFYTPKDATETCYVLEAERSITQSGLKNCNSRLYEQNTVFISARGTVGKLNLSFNAFGGVNIVEATKQLYAGTLVGAPAVQAAQAARRRFLTAPKPLSRVKTPNKA